MAKPEQIIRKAAKILGATLLTSVAALSAANAATTSQSEDFSLGCAGGDIFNPTPCSATSFLTFDQFDPADGTLNGVSLEVESEIFAFPGVATATVRFQMADVMSTIGSFGPFNETTSLNGFGLAAFEGPGVDALTFGLFLDVSGGEGEWSGLSGMGKLTLTYDFDENRVPPNVVPLPASAGFLAVGLLGLGWAGRRKS